MLLIICSRKDMTTEFVEPHIKKPVVKMVYNDEPLPKYKYYWNGKRFVYEYDGIDLNEITSVWYKVGIHFYYKEQNASFEQLNRLCREEITNYVEGILADRYWMNRPTRVKIADNKQYQLELATKMGMDIPLTLVTSSPDEATKFRAEVGTIITKPIAKNAIAAGNRIQAIYTVRITPEMDVDFSLLPISPAIFQEEIQRQADIRAIVVKDRVFAVSIVQVGEKAGGVDYRQYPDSQLHFEPLCLPQDVQSNCVSLVKALGLEYAALDFVLGKNGKYYFLESNATGAWYYVQKQGNFPIGECIADALQ